MAKKKKKDPGAKALKKEKKLLRKQELAAGTVPLAPTFASSIGIANPIQAQKVDYLFNTLSHAETFKDPVSSSSLIMELNKELNSAEFTGKDYAWSYLGVPDVFGFRGFSSQFTQIMGSGFSVFRWISENYWPVLDCINILWREILADGYRLEGGSKEEQARAREVCKALNMKRLRCQIAADLKIYGNSFFKPIRNGLKGIKEVKPLLPSYIRPIPTYDGMHIKEWQVQEGAYYRIYQRDDLMYCQFRRSGKNYDIGSPPLGAVLVDIEGDVSASEFNCALFQKGGLYGIAVLLESQQGGSRGKGPSAYAQYMQANLQSNHSGNRSAYESVVFEGAKDVKVLNKLSEMDAPFMRSSDSTAKKSAHAFGIPHEMIGIITNANQQYHPSSFLDYNMKQLDKTIAELLDVVDTFINTKLFPMLGIKNVRIVASPRYSSVTRVATQAGLDLGSLYGVVSVDEYRRDYLGRGPLPNGEGLKMLQKVQLDGGTKPGATGGGGKPSQVIIPPDLPPIENDSPESDLGPSEGEP